MRLTSCLCFQPTRSCTESAEHLLNSRGDLSYFPSVGCSCYRFPSGLNTKQYAKLKEMLNFNPLQAFYHLIWSSDFQLSTLWKVCQVSPFLASCRSWCWLAVPSSALWSNTSAVKNTSLSWLFFIIPFDFSVVFWSCSYLRWDFASI